MQAADARKVDAKGIASLQKEYLFPCVGTYYEEPVGPGAGQGHAS